jgi:hypothetical protein
LSAIISNVLMPKGRCRTEHVIVLGKPLMSYFLPISFPSPSASILTILTLSLEEEDEISGRIYKGSNTLDLLKVSASRSYVGARF